MAQYPQMPHLLSSLQAPHGSETTKGAAEQPLCMPSEYALEAYFAEMEQLLAAAAASSPQQRVPFAGLESQELPPVAPAF